MKIVIPIAGKGLRFSDLGMDIPKPLIQVEGRPMIAWALESIIELPYTRSIFVALKEHDLKFGVTELLHELVGSSCKVILLDQVTEGQLCTVLAARHLIDSDEDLLIASADTFVVSNLAQDIASRTPDCRGIISVANMPGERWSFARTDETGRVVEVAEKERISNHASTGLYYFSNGNEFVETAEEIIRMGEKTRGEFYVIPVYHKYIQRGWRVGISIAEEMWDMGAPEALQAFKKHLKKSKGDNQESAR